MHADALTSDSIVHQYLNCRERTVVQQALTIRPDDIISPSTVLSFSCHSRRVKFDRLTFYPDAAFGHPYGSCFEVQGQQLVGVEGRREVEGTGYTVDDVAQYYNYHNVQNTENFIS